MKIDIAHLLSVGDANPPAATDLQRAGVPDLPTRFGVKRRIFYNNGDLIPRLGLLHRLVPMLAEFV